MRHRFSDVLFCALRRCRRDGPVKAPASGGRRRFRAHASTQAGVSLVELLIYLAVLVLLLVVIVAMIVGLSGSYRQMATVETVEDSGTFAFERMTREIRNASSVDTSASTLGSHPGVLRVVTYDGSGTQHTITFSEDQGRILMTKDGSSVGYLTRDESTVTDLVFRHITTSASDAVRIEMTLEAGEGEVYRSEPFSTTVVLRGSYEGS